MWDAIAFLPNIAPTFVACVTVCCAAIADAERPDAESGGERADVEARSAEQPPPSDGANQHVVSEIERIRRRLGVDPFRGTIFDNVEPVKPDPGDDASGGDAAAAQEGFDAAIRAVAAQQAGRNRRPINWQPTDARHLPPVRPATPVGVLRQAARTLEDQAADLDGVGLYPEADRLRTLADQFWQRARELEQPPETGGETP